MKNFDQDKFLNDILNSVVLKNISFYSDVNKAWELWKTEFLYICNKHAPLKLSRVKQLSSPWLTNDILDLMYQRDYLHKKAIASNSESDYNAFKLSKNKVMKLEKQKGCFILILLLL